MARDTPCAALTPMSGAPRTCIVSMPTAASSTVAQRTSTRSCGSRVWSMTSTAPSAANPIVRIGTPSTSTLLRYGRGRPRGHLCVPGRLLVGQRRIVDAVRGGGAGLGLAGLGAGRQGAGVRRRQRLRHPVRRGLRQPRRPRAHPPPPLDRVGPHRARAGSARPRGDRALPRGAAGRPGRRHRAVGHAAPLHAARVVLGGREGLRRPAGPLVLLAPPRRLHGRDLRRPRLRLEAGQRAVGLRAARLAAAACSRRGCPTPSGSPRRSRRSTSPPSTPRCGSARRASRSRRSTTSRRSSRPSPCPTSRWPETGSTTSSTACGWRRCATGSSTCGAVEPIERDEFREAFDLIGFSYYNAMSIDRDGRIGPYPADARRGPMGYAPWSEGLGLLLQRLAEDLPDPPLLVCEHGIGTDDDGWREEFLRESLGFVRPGASPTGSTSAGSSTGPRSTTTSGPTATRSGSVSSTADRTPKPSTALMRSWAQSSR